MFDLYAIAGLSLGAAIACFANGLIWAGAAWMLVTIFYLWKGYKDDDK